MVAGADRCWDGRMDHHAVRDRYDQLMRRDAPADAPGARVEHDGRVVRQIVPDGAGWHGVRWSGLDEATADAAIADQIRTFAPFGHPFEWKVYAHDRFADLPRRLRAAGFVPEPPEALMVAEVGALSADVTLPAGVRLHEVTDAAGVDLMVRVQDEVFDGAGSGMRPWLLALLERAPETVQLVVAMAGDRPVSAARAELTPGGEFAGLWGGGTLPDWRGRGVYRALVAHRARTAAARGYRWLQVDATDDSRPILERLGFQRLSTTTPYVYRPGEDARRE